MEKEADTKTEAEYSGENQRPAQTPNNKIHKLFSHKTYLRQRYLKH